MREQLVRSFVALQEWAATLASASFNSPVVLLSVSCVIMALFDDLKVAVPRG